jgi:hypothetical protein
MHMVMVGVLDDLGLRRAHAAVAEETPAGQYL